MPLFFIISGYFMNTSMEVGETAKKMYHSTIIPYFVVAIIISSYECIINNSFMQLLTVPLVIWRFHGNLVSVGAIWFLPALFIGKIWAIWTSNKVNGYYYLLLGALTAIIFTKVTKIILPFAIEQALIAAPFILIGSKLREWSIFNRVIRQDIIFSISLALLCFAPSMSVGMRVISITPYNYVSATLLTIIIVITLKKIDEIDNKIIRLFNYFFTWCGRYSLIILCAHSIEARIGCCNLPHNLFPLEVVIRITYIIAITWICTKIKITKKLFCIK